MDDAAQDALRQAFGCRIDWCDPAKMDSGLGGIVFDHLELRMIHAKTFPAQLRFAENNQLLAGRDHLLDVMQIKPAQRQRLAKHVRVWFLQRRLKNFLPAAEAKNPRLGHFTAQTDRRIAFLAWELRKLMSIFVASRIMREQIFRS